MENFTNSSTMRAAVLEEYNSPLLLTEIARPKAGAGQVLVRIRASGVNPLEHQDSDGEWRACEADSAGCAGDGFRGRCRGGRGWGNWLQRGG
jgi:hypothetical protein